MASECFRIINNLNAGHATLGWHSSSDVPESATNCVSNFTVGKRSCLEIIIRWGIQLRMNYLTTSLLKCSEGLISVCVTLENPVPGIQSS